LEQLQVVGASAGTFSQGIKEVETNYVVWNLLTIVIKLSVRRVPIVAMQIALLCCYL